jgi:sulfite reductase (NADPH) flavoprotein alpha-component
MTPAMRLLWAALVLLAYAGACLALYRHRCAQRLRAQRDAAALVPAAGDATPVLVVHASQTGHAEQIAWQTARTLHTAGVPVLLRPLGELGAEALQRAERVLFIASTYGEGDPPDSAATFARRVMAQPLALPRLGYGVLALGDRGYARFCGFGRALDAWLAGCGAQPLFERVELDNADEATLLHWRHLLARVAGTSDLAAWEAPAFEPWRLAARRWLNEGSPGAPCFLVTLQPPAGAHWEAGDLLQVQVPDDPEHPREYSIASLPADGTLQLLVRQARRDDGTLGLASGWLTHVAALGAPVLVRLRAHRNFRIDGNAARPLILIGNGTGLAGLRAHLKARAAQPGGAPVWLLYGERSSAHDRHLGDEIDAWMAQGVLRHADLVYSRDQAERRHVQHALAESAQCLREWVDAGAALYVCGSLEGMAKGVDEVLAQVLGADALARLADAGRYRRDVY